MKKQAIIHPFLFALYPVVFLFSQNIAQVSPGDIWVPLIVILLFLVTGFTITMAVYRDIEKTAAVVSSFLFLFFSYGHLLKALAHLRISRPDYLFAGECLVLAMAMYGIKKTKKKMTGMTRSLNIVAVSMVFISLTQIGVFRFRAGIINDQTPHPVRGGEAVGYDAAKANKIKPTPNIFYIIMDAYARYDVLKDVFGYENDEFINALHNRGFYVADKSVANYPITQLSMASSLNLDYLDRFSKKMGEDNTDYDPMLPLIWEGRVSKFLKQYGYRTLFVCTAGLGLEAIKKPNLYVLEHKHGWLSNDFHRMVLNATPLPYLFVDVSEKVFDEFDFHRKQILYAFDKISDLSKGKGPFFLIAHIIKPHVPFVFSETGNPISPHRSYGLWYSVQSGMDRDEYIDFYKRQISFINKKILSALDDVMGHSSTPPIVILQSDHGPSLGYDGEELENTDIRTTFSMNYSDNC